MALSDGDLAIDIGCGDFENSFLMASVGFSVTSIDLLDKTALLTHSIHKNRISFIREDFLNFHSKSQFDLCVCISVLHFLDLEKIPLAIKKLSTLTKTNGILLLSAFTTKNEGGMFKYLFKPTELRNYIEAEWKVLDYQEYYLKDKHSPNNSHHTARIIAKKIGFS